MIIVNKKEKMKMKRILTGDRPTGRLHLGHYVGSLENRVKLQDDYDTFIIIADVQGLTTHFKNPDLLRESIFQVAMDNLSVGLDPDKITMFLQSKVASIAELTIFYSMLVSVNSLRHNPTIKSEAKQYGYDDLTYGFLGYPVSQTADMTFCNADLVPVGEDQIPHIEQGRKIVRRFNSLYEDVLKEPEVLVSNTPRLMGLDGNSKMGKSLGNGIYLSDSPEEVKNKVKSALTDPNRIRVNDKGNPDICVVSKYHSIFNSKDYENIRELCKAGSIGCLACKKKLSEEINTLLDPIREKRSYYEDRRNLVRDIILEGSLVASKIGNETVDKVKSAMKIDI